MIAGMYFTHGSAPFVSQPVMVARLTPLRRRLTLEQLQRRQMSAVEYRIKGRIWPMLEQNSTFWSGGTLDGMKEGFLTPGVIFGPFPVTGRLRFLVGSGIQIAVTQFHQFNHRWILSIRFPF